ncbi:MAG: CocE/NonD family hydrolase C-terminal non-catalytic domain-containing protein [Woeseiaceae bacterium]|nr:CocE/NonD family hydrolase C-terminal non-catalytic domain-containing protein [Woeseiaceae bacterium]
MAFYFEGLRHPPESDWWDWAEIQGNYANMDAAVLNLSGWHDESYGSQGAATNFNGIRASRDGRRPAGNDMLRASYRDSNTGRQLLEPERVYELTLDQLVTANRFARGDRIRVQISASFAPHFSRNLQTGESEVTSDRAKVATITIHHDRSRPSLVRLPVIAE